MKRLFVLVLLLCAASLPAPTLAADLVDSPAETEAPGILDDLFKVNFRNLTFGQNQWPEKPFFGNDNPFDLSSDSLESDFRLDLEARLPYLEVVFKPRWDLTWEKWESGRKQGEEESGENAYVNEWRARVQPLDSLSLSYGRENLQWGPAMLLSPSNPFFTENGKSQPKREVPGADYVRLVWTPDQNWTASLIVNTDEGRKRMREEFAKTYACKVDFSAEQSYASLTLAKRESGDWRVGGFISWNLDEATILYAEGSGTTDGEELLFGGSYTFVDGGMLTVEYFHNGFGSAGDDLLTLLASKRWLDFRQLLLRENYLLVQFYKQDPMGEWTSLLRLTANLDDHSSALLGAVEYSISDHVQLFANGTLFHGNNDDELSALLDYQMMVGVELFY